MKRNKVLYICVILLLLGLILFALFGGNSAVSAKDVFSVLLGKGSRSAQVILLQIRIPRIAAAVFAGAALSVSGYLLQNNLNNMLASPSLLGINSGAGLGVLLSALIFPYRFGVKCFAAFLGAFLVTLLVYLLSSTTGMSKSSVILSGVAFSALCSSFINIIISLRPETVADKAAFQIGGFSALPITVCFWGVPVILAGLLTALLSAPALDILLLGDESAKSLGVNVRLYRGIHIMCAALLSGAAVSMCGVLSFVGLLIPNIVRLFYKGRARGSVVFSMLFGACFLLLCDTLSKFMAFPYELPCGLLISCIGAPFFIGILIKKRKKLGTKE
ncbi:MAG: iron ABC transporter permease [Lachnospiraceae bacterium]|nr:iron ABC transporter permease [Lachnospiraceae bacterium]